MGTQNLNNFYFKRLDAKLNYSEYYDIFLASDERDFNQQVVYSNNIIDYNNGNKLPVWIDLNDTNCSTQPTTTCPFQYPTGATPTYYTNNSYRPFVVLSKNYWSGATVECNCPYSGGVPFEVCDALWTSLDNGLYNPVDFSNEQCLLLYPTLPALMTFDVFSYDKRFKMHQVKAFGFPWWVNTFYTDTSILDASDYSGYYQQLRGGFYQGFYKLYGYPYEILPTRPNKGWSFEGYLKLNTIGDSLAGSGSTVDPHGNFGNCYNTSGWNSFNDGTYSATNFCSETSNPPNGPSYQLNYTERTPTGFNIGRTDKYGFFFYKGIRAEDKYFHSDRFTGTTYKESFSGLSACTTLSGITGCCNNLEDTVKLTGQNQSPTAEYDVYSNAIGFRITDDMRIGYRTIRYTGGCITTGITAQMLDGWTWGDPYYYDDGDSGYWINPGDANYPLEGLENVCNTAKTFECGYEIEESYSEPICAFISQSGTCENTWIQVDVVFDRYLYLEDCEIYNNGGVNDLVKVRVDRFQRYGTHKPHEDTRGPFGCHCCGEHGHEPTCKDEYPAFIEDAYFDFDCHKSQVQSWFEEKNYRLGTLTFYVNGRRVHKIENFEEIIPRQLNTNKQTQVGVAYNMSWGGGALGLRENLYSMSCVTNSTLGNLYPEPDQRLIMENFAGSFIGGISQMMYYIKPLTPDEVYHNFLINRTRYGLIDCEECEDCNTGCGDCVLPGATTTTIDPNPVDTFEIHIYRACPGTPVPQYLADGFPVTINGVTGPSSMNLQQLIAESEDFYQTIGAPPPGTVIQRGVTQNNGSIYYSCWEYQGLETHSIPGAPPMGTFITFNANLDGVTSPALTGVFQGGPDNCDECVSLGQNPAP
tara:strand:- start:3288 stop:5885 length:2598 start_codon:yes stop_codon:yes gene_type:complete